MNSKKIIIGMLVALAVAAFISPLASSSPDGLERVAEDKGFMEKGKEIVDSPMPDYVIPGLGNETVAGSTAGIVGTILTFGLMYGVARIITVKRKLDD